jgi:monooxygenase
VSDFDIVIVGAGLSGIGAAYRLRTECPSKSIAIFEGRDAMGGTWDLFRYPGIRSDSDMFTLGYAFHPWRDGKAIADGPSILAYIRETAAKFDLERLVRYRHRIVEASWSSDEAMWTLDVEVDGQRKRHRCRFLYLCTGYYDYEKAHTPDLPGLERFAGKVVHPQWWPEDLDYAGQRVVVIGSGATAITLVPALAERAAHVTMLQRSPTYIASLPSKDAIADAIRGVLPADAAHRVVRGKNVLVTMAFYQLCRRWPKVARWLLVKGVEGRLPKGYPVTKHFTPKYAPWDQRLCLVPDDDFFVAISAGKASVVTDTIQTFTEHGIRLTSGDEIEADVIVTATGLKLRACGGIRITIDGRALRLADTFVYKGMMLSGVPNLAWCIGYTNASWTLRADAASRYVCRLVNYMDRRGYAVAMPSTAEEDPKPLLDLASGYIARALDELPKQGRRTPWYYKQNYLYDLPTMLYGPVDDAAMVFRPPPPVSSRRVAASA